jgi:Ca-activated chloride channel family protein
MRSRGRLAEFLLALVLVLGIRVIADADALGTVSGRVLSGSTPVAHATVTVTCGATTRTVTADASGKFSVTGMPPAACTISVTAAGFARHAARVTLASGGTAAVTVALPSASKPAEKAMPKESQRSPSASPPSPVRTRATGSVGLSQPLVLDQPNNTEQYARIDDSPFYRAETAPLSTFSADVDTASYSNIRRFLRDGARPPKDAVRIEEMINYFPYTYPAPAQGKPFSITTDIGTAPWNPKHMLVRVGLAAPAIDDRKAPSGTAQIKPPARNLVFLLDVSGSMVAANKLPLLKQALGLLVDTLRPEDTVSIVVYAGASGVALPPTPGTEKDTIRQAIFALDASGSTNGAQGIQLAYDLAEKTRKKQGINRVILCTDGDFNVGVTNEGDLTRLIERERERGVFLTVLGFGMGNLKDSTLEKLADRGNGNYAYIDSLFEARKVLVKEAGATLETVAKDVKLQVELNPALVAGYRLIGYENRVMKHEDFNDDKKDAGEIGAGHAVTALYEVVPVGQEVPSAKIDALKYQNASTKAAAADGELMTVKVRYKAPDGKTSKLLQHVVKGAPAELAKLSDDFRWATAIAGFGMMLRESPHRGSLSWAQVEALAVGARGADPDGYRQQALEMIRRARKLPANP